MLRESEVVLQEKVHEVIKLLEKTGKYSPERSTIRDALRGRRHTLKNRPVSNETC